MTQQLYENTTALFNVVGAIPTEDDTGKVFIDPDESVTQSERSRRYMMHDVGNDFAMYLHETDVAARPTAQIEPLPEQTPQSLTATLRENGDDLVTITHTIITHAERNIPLGRSDVLEYESAPGADYTVTDAIHDYIHQHLRQ